MLFPADTAQIYSVSALAGLVKARLEQSFPYVWVRGEVTDYKAAPSGHMYFSLKDDAALIRCVWFGGRRRKAEGQKFNPLTGEVFDRPRPDMEKIMRDGLELVCSGSVELYAKSGQCQLVVEYAELSGQGALALAFERLKAEYAAAGYFEAARKRPLPSYPSRIALITSPKGAAIHDFLKIASVRGLSSTIRLFPTPVQGAGAARKMAQAIEEANRQGWAQLIVLIRGGGSAEDLMEFNEPVLVEAIYNSRIPVLAGIGHEVDIFLSDMTADKRAATPSHAAQILWPLRRDLQQRLDDLDLALNRRADIRLGRFEEALAQKSRALGWLSPAQKLSRLEERLRELAPGLRARGRNILADKGLKLERLAERALKAGSFFNKIDLLSERLLWLGRSSRAAAESMLKAREGNFLEKSARFESAASSLLDRREGELEKLDARLGAHNPGALMRKGWALLSDSKGIIHSVANIKAGQELAARLADGTLELTVKAVRKNGDNPHA